MSADHASTASTPTAARLPLATRQVLDSPRPVPSRRAMLGTAALLAPAALAGCGPGAGGGGNGRAEGLLVSWYGGVPVHEGVDGALAAFTTAHPDIPVTSEKAEFSAYWDKLATQTAGGQGPDVFRMSMSYFQEYADRGALLDLSDFIGDALDISSLDADVAASGDVGGGTFGIGQSSITHATFRNTRLAEEHGIALPAAWSWDDFAEFCRSLAGAAGEGVYGSTDASGSFQIFEVWARQHGIDQFTEEGYAGTAELVEEWFALWQGLRAAKAVPPADITAEAGGFENSPLSLGNAAVEFGWVQQIAFYQPFLPEAPLEVAPVPGMTAGDLSGQFVKALDLWCVAATSANPEGAAQLIDFMVNDEEAVRSIGLTLGVPPSESSRELLAAAPDTPEGRAIAYVESITGSTGEAPGPWPVGYSTLLDAFSRVSQDVAFGNAEPSAAADDFVAQAQEAIASA
ncbi:ABC transporter substrate-binding protein [Brachybacterium phenoliresistens]|uniref:ABC transporter substrate-binding protein n=1 Tax=Brachybacterium phenoliresistens TaxID=396014 RepID=UPI0031D12FF9